MKDDFLVNQVEIVSVIYANSPNDNEECLQIEVKAIENLFLDEKKKCSKCLRNVIIRKACKNFEDIVRSFYKKCDFQLIWPHFHNNVIFRFDVILLDGIEDYGCSKGTIFKVLLVKKKVRNNKKN